MLSCRCEVIGEVAIAPCPLYGRSFPWVLAPVRGFMTSASTDTPPMFDSLPLREQRLILPSVSAPDLSSFSTKQHGAGVTPSDFPKDSVWKQSHWGLGIQHLSFERSRFTPQQSLSLGYFVKPKQITRTIWNTVFTGWAPSSLTTHPDLSYPPCSDSGFLTTVSVCSLIHPQLLECGPKHSRCLEYEQICLNEWYKDV